MDGEDEDRGRVKWNFGTRSWHVHYQDAGGSWHTTAKRLQVANHDFNGRALDTDAYEAARTHMLARARMRWNELDESATEYI